MHSIYDARWCSELIHPLIVWNNFFPTLPVSIKHFFRLIIMWHFQSAFHREKSVKTQNYYRQCGATIFLVAWDGIQTLKTSVKKSQKVWRKQHERWGIFKASLSFLPLPDSKSIFVKACLFFGLLGFFYLFRKLLEKVHATPYQACHRGIFSTTPMSPFVRRQTRSKQKWQRSGKYASVMKR